jgi:hypothetical protein
VLVSKAFGKAGVQKPEDYYGEPDDEAEA